MNGASFHSWKSYFPGPSKAIAFKMYLTTEPKSRPKERVMLRTSEQLCTRPLSKTSPAAMIVSQCLFMPSILE